MDWKTALEYQNRVFGKLYGAKNEKGPLRFGRSHVIVSDIASQFYSELKLIKDYEEGKETTLEMLEGTKAHDKLSEDYEAITLEEGWENLMTKREYWLAEFPFVANHDAIPIVGKPDLIRFKQGIPVLLFEYKFTKHPEAIPGLPNELRGQFRNRHVQAQAYGMILHDLGFNTDLLFYVIIAFKPETSKKDKIIKKIPFEIAKSFDDASLVENDERVFDLGDIRAYSYKYDHEEALKHLKWAMAFWTNEREPGEYLMED